MRPQWTHERVHLPVCLDGLGYEEDKAKMDLIFIGVRGRWSAETRGSHHAPCASEDGLGCNALCSFINEYSSPNSAK